MREIGESLGATVLGKVRREGILALLREGPPWVVGTTLTECRLATLRWIRRTRYRRAGMVAISDPTATIEINPASVTQVVPLERFDGLPPRALLGVVQGGDWDHSVTPIEDQPKYRACAGRVAGQAWTETGIVDLLAGELAASDADSIEHGCDSRAALRERYEGPREKLYRSLRNSGYDRTESPVCCRIHVGRDGGLLFGSGGRHRFFLSRLLGIESVPVQVLCRHSQWQAVREVVARSGLPDDASIPREHPDLRDLIDG